MDKPKRLEYHPLANLFPMLEKADLLALAEDLKKPKGQRAPITLYEGKILDGRNRYEACEIAGREPKFTEFKGDDPLDFVISANLRRRHLTDPQRAIIAAKLTDLYRKAGHSASKDAMTEEEAARTLKVSRASVTRAKRVLRTASKDAIKGAEEGKKSLSEAGGRESPEPKQLTDNFNLPVPDGIRENWKEADKVGRALSNAVSKVKCDVEEALKGGDKMFCRVTNQTVADLKNAYTSLQCVRPHTVCPRCHGKSRKGCRLCRENGWLDEFTYTHTVPKEERETHEKGPAN